jgi:hypothetical protein
MNLIAHRILTIDELKKVPKEYGVEIDLREGNGDIILAHDPFKEGISLDEYLDHYNHSFLILNVKASGLAEIARQKLKARGIENYFFLDCTFPEIIYLIRLGEEKVSLRYSEFEGMDSIRPLAGKASWVWVDQFFNFTLDRKTFLDLKDMGFKVCLVAPELLGRDKESEEFRNRLLENGIFPDAICTKLYSFEGYQSLEKEKTLWQGKQRGF